MYDLAISADDTRFDIVIGKAFASLSQLSLEKINVDFFKKIFEQGIELIDQEDCYTYHNFILYKSWSIMPYLLELNLKNFMNMANSNFKYAANIYVENLLLMYDVQMIISNVVDENVLLDKSQKDSMQSYIKGYIELKNTIIAHGNNIFNSANKFGVKIEKAKIKEIKENIKNSEKKIKSFQ